MTMSTPSGIGFSGVEGVFVEVVHEGIVSELGRVRRSVYAESDAIPEREVVCSFCEVEDSR
jgi:hypothetical protein